MIAHGPQSTLFPYTTLFRSQAIHGLADGRPRGRATADGRLAKMPPRSRLVFLSAGNARPRDLEFAMNPNVAQEIGRHTSELQSPMYLVCRLLLEKKKKTSTA